MEQEQEQILTLHRLVRPGRAVASTETITGLVVKAVNETEALVVCPKGAENLPARALLGVVTYCYAKGVCGSGEIEERLWADGEVRRVLADGIPDAKAIRRFRRLNRPAVQAALERTLKSVRRLLARRTMAQTLVPESAPNKQPCGPAGETTFLVRREVTARLDTACMLDSMLDD